MKRMLNKINPAILLTFVAVLILMALILGKETRNDSEPVADVPTREYSQPQPIKAVKEREIEIPTEEDKEDAQSVASSFVLSFHELDAEDPTAYAENAKPYMTADLYELYTGVPKRGTLEVSKLKTVGVETTPVDYEKNQQIWLVGVTSEQTDINGETELVFSSYNVLVIKDGQEWKVGSVAVNE